MEDSIVLQEVILTRITTNLKLPSHSNRTVQLTTLFNAIMDLAVVVLEIQRVIVNAAQTDFNMKLSEFH